MSSYTELICCHICLRRLYSEDQPECLTIKSSDLSKSLQSLDYSVRFSHLKSEKFSLSQRTDLGNPLMLRTITMMRRKRRSHAAQSAILAARETFVKFDKLFSSTYRRVELDESIVSKPFRSNK